MDTHIAASLGLPQPGVSAELFEAYKADQNASAANELKEARSSAFWSRITSVAALLVGAAAVGGAAVTLYRYSGPQWGLLSYDSATGHVEQIKNIRDVAMTLPANVDQWFLKRYVQLREQYNDTGATADFDAVACMSDAAEQVRFEAWYNKDRRAPQQVIAKTRAHGFRSVSILSDPGNQGVNATGGRRVAVRFSYQDFGGDAQKPALGTAYFTWRKDIKALKDCNPSALVVSDFEHHFDLEPK